MFHFGFICILGTSIHIDVECVSQPRIIRGGLSILDLGRIGSRDERIKDTYQKD